MDVFHKRDERHAEPTHARACAHTHSRTHARTHARTHTHTHLPVTARASEALGGVKIHQKLDFKII